MSSTDLNMEGLRALAQRDLAASNELQARIDHLQQQLEEGGQPTLDATSLMSDEYKRIGRDLVLRMDQIEASGQLNATDRMMLQAMTVRLAVHDLQTARLAEYRDLQLRDGDEKTREWLRHDHEVPEQGQAGPWLNTNVDVPEPPGFPSTLPPADQKMLFGVDASTRNTDDEEGAGASDTADEDGPDPPSWPLLYQIMGIDPKTPDRDFKQDLDERMKSLALKHDPVYFPNSPSALQRWTACEKAYAILAEPERKRFYDARGKVPEALIGFDVSSLRI